jgi:hypothetical protein
VTPFEDSDLGPVDDVESGRQVAADRIHSRHTDEPFGAVAFELDRTVVEHGDPRGPLFDQTEVPPRIDLLRKLRVPSCEVLGAVIEPPVASATGGHSASRSASFLDDVHTEANVGQFSGTDQSRKACADDRDSVVCTSDFNAV